MSHAINEDELLDTVQRKTFGYCLYQCNLVNGLIADSNQIGVPDSIAAVGLALAVDLVGVERGFVNREEARKRTLAILRFFWNSPQGSEPNATGYQGFYYHFLDMQTGRRQLRLYGVYQPTYPSGILAKLGLELSQLGWVSPWSLGLDQGPIVLMIENYRSGFLWRLMKQCSYLVAGLRRAGVVNGWLEGV